MTVLPARLAAAWVFAILLGSYAYYQPSRDWNSASRLMLTYALGDRGTVRIDGLERQTGDKARFRGHYYSDKGPGFSLLALPPYLISRAVLGLPEHPIDRDGFADWPADYTVTLATSGLSTALTGALLTILAARLGCGPRRSALVGLAYGLATPAYAYATLAYGHQATSLFLIGSFALVWGSAAPSRPRLQAFFAGLLASYAAINELSVGPVAAILGLALLTKVVRGGWPSSAILTFGFGALGPVLILLFYNTIAFGSPLELGYAHHDIPRFRKVHAGANPTGLRAPAWSLIGLLLFGRYRGLLFYAPIVALAPIGWWAMIRRGWVGAAFTSLTAFWAVFLVNLSYPEWTGGWSTGPRLLVPALPFAMVAVGAALGWGRGGLALVAAALTLVGAVVVGMFLGIGGRIPEGLEGIDLSDPFFAVVLPHWRGDPVEPWWIGGRYVGNLVASVWPAVNDPSVVPPGWQWVQFTPLWAGQALAISLMFVTLRRRPSRPYAAV